MYVAILDATHGNVQQPAYNLVAVLPFTEQFFALHYVTRILTPQPMTSLPLVTTPIQVHGLYNYGNDLVSFPDPQYGLEQG